MSNRAIISVVTPVLNGAETLERNLQSVWNARHLICEHVIQDGGSTDGSQDILKAWEQKTDGFVKPVFEPDGGIADAFNRGIKRANGAWIAILNADDWYDEKAFELIEPLLIRKMTILHGMIRQHRPGGVVRDVGKRNYDPKRHFRPRITMPAQHPTCIVSKDVYERTGLFNTNYSIAMDYDFLLRAHLAGATFHYIPQVITNFTVGGISSTDPLLAAREMMDSKIRNLGSSLQPRLWYLKKWVRQMIR